MTISSETIKVQTAGNGSTTKYYFTFTIYEDTDLEVLVIDDETEVETELTLNSDYTVSVSGKYITLTAGTLCPTGSTLNIISDIPYTQETDFVDGSAMSAEVLETAYDKLTILILQVKNLLDQYPTLAEVLAETSIAAALSATHNQNVDTYLDYGGTNQVSAAQAKTGYTHSQVVTGNPHSVTTADLNLDNLDNVQQMPLSYLDTDNTLAGNSDSKVPSQKAVKTYIATETTGMADADHEHSADEITSGTFDGDLLPVISTTKKGAVPATGTPSGKFLKDDGSWDDAPGAASGDVVGPASSTDADIVLYDGTTGKAIKDSGTTITTSVGSPGADTKIPTEAAVRAAITDAGGGNVSGPESSTNNAITRFDSTTGKIIQNSSATIDDNGSINIPTGQKYKINNVDLTYTDVAAAASDHDHTDIYKAAGADETGNVTAASTTTAGKVELAIAAEVTSGGDDTRAVTPDALAGSVYGKRIIQIKLVDDATALTTGDGKVYFCISSELDGYNLVDVDAMVSTVSSSGTPTYQIYNVTQTADMLSTRITIDANEYTSYSAAAQPVIDTSNDDVATGDILRIDKDVAGTGEKGDTIILSFQLP